MCDSGHLAATENFPGIHGGATVHEPVPDVEYWCAPETQKPLPREWFFCQISLLRDFWLRR